MGQFSKVLLAIDNANNEPQMALDCGPGLGGLGHVYGPNCSTMQCIGLFLGWRTQLDSSIPDCTV